MPISRAREFFEAGLASFDAGDFTGAAGFFEQALKLAPERESIWLNLVSTQLELSNLEMATALIKDFEMSPAFTRSGTYLGCKATLFFKKSDFTAAKNFFLNAADASDDASEANRYLYYCFLASIQTDSRELLENSLAERGVSERLGEERIIEVRTRIALKFGDFAQAKSLLTKVPLTTNLTALLLDALIGLGEFDRAIELVRGPLANHVSIDRALLVGRNAGSPAPDETKLIKTLESNLQDLQKCEPITLRFFSDDPDAISVATHSFAKRLKKGKRLSSQKGVRSINGARMRVGFFSSDLRDHAVGFLVHDLLIDLQKQCDLFVFHLNPPDFSDIYQSLRNSLKNFIHLDYFCSAEILAQSISDYHLDVLVDLGGFTKYSRPDVIALLTDSIKVNYLGYPGESPCDVHDVTISDAVISPPSQSPKTGQIAYLPLCYQIVSPSILFSQPTPRSGPEKWRREIAILSNPNKIGSKSLDLWGAFMEAAPDRCLKILSPGEFYDKNLSDCLQEKTYSDRLGFIRPITHKDHLSRISSFAFVLDSFPYGSHTTSSDVVSRCTPIVTRIGRCFHSRVCASVLQALDLHELVAESDEQYLEVALRLSNDEQFFQAIINKLKISHQSEFFNLPKRSVAFYKLLWEIG